MSAQTHGSHAEEAGHAYAGPMANKLTGHSYDGIEEFDNPTPGWWHAIFITTILFAMAYALYWHASVLGTTIQDDWGDDQKADFARVFGSVGELKADEETILTQMKNEKFMAVAKATFVGNCAACHKRDGGGEVGVNLCDDYYKNVTKIEDIYRVISEGANGGAMPPWKNRLTSNERVIVAAYVASLRGSTPASAKAPEGKIIDPWPKGDGKSPAK